MKRGEVLMQENPLPEGYQRLNYIECTGRNYIDTKVLITPELEWYIEIQWLEFNTNNCFGCEDWAGGTNIIRIDSRTNTTPPGAHYVYGDTVSPGYSVGYLGSQTTEKVTFLIRRGSQQINGVELSTRIMTKSQTDSSKPILYFAAKTNTVMNYYCKRARHYYSYMKYGETMIREFIPALRISDSKPGLYDAVNDEFYINQGTGEFLYG